MNYLYHIAFIGKRPIKNYKPSDGWLLIREADGGGWTDEFKQMKGVEENDEVWFDYHFSLFSPSKIYSGGGGNYLRGNSPIDYWYYEFPDGKNAIIMAEGIIKQNLEAIKRSIQNNYDAAKWEDLKEKGERIILDF